MVKHELLDWLARSALLEAAVRGGILQALLAEPLGAGELARRCSVDPRALDLLLEALVAHELLKRRGAVFEPGDAVLALNDDPPNGFGWISRLWSHLPTFLATGAPLFQMDGDSHNRSQQYGDVVAWLGDMFAAAAASIAQKLGPAPTVLDLGAGSGVWSLAMAALSPDSRVCAVDFPVVLPSFHNRARALGLAARSESVAGDLHTIELNRRFHRVVVANVLHLESPERAQAIIRRCTDWLLPDGELVIVGTIVSDSVEAERARTLYSLHLALRTKEGQNHAAAELDRWCRQVGLESTRLVKSDASSPGALGAMVARH
jgi:2-polyprenyl-3-methyl-5-hydroxy-6-metoxy-1,4-benzoquinol methylase